MNASTTAVVLLSLLQLSGCALLASFPSPTGRTSTRTFWILGRRSPEIEPYSKFFPLQEPVASLSDEQVAEVRDCKVVDLARQRYPKEKSTRELIRLYLPQNSCDWAALAYEYVTRLKRDGDKVPRIAKDAFA